MARTRKTGGSDHDLDKLYRNVNRLRGQVQAVGGNQMLEMMAAPALQIANPSDPFRVDKEPKNAGELVTVEVRLAGTETDISLTLIRTSDNPPSGSAKDVIIAARGKRLTFNFNDITDEEREAKTMRRQLRPPLEFLTAYGLCMIEARVVDASGRVGRVLNPPTNPFKQAPFPYLKMVNAQGAITTDAVFVTCDKTGTNCPDAQPMPGVLGPGRFSPSQEFCNTFRGKQDGVKPILNITIPPTLKTLDVVLVAEANFDPNADLPTEAEQDTISITRAERQAQFIQRRFGKLLDFNTKYILLQLTGRGDNVGGPDRDTIELKATSIAGIKDRSKSMDTTTNPAANRAEFTTPNKGAVDGGGNVGFNADLKPALGFCNSDKNTDGTLKNFLLDGDGVFPIMEILLPRPGPGLPSTADSVKARVLPEKQRMKGAFRNTKDGGDWDDISVEEQEDAVIRRQFDKRLKFNQKYNLIQLIGEGANLGGPGVDKAKNPFPQPGPTEQPVILASFTTPDEDGNFPEAIDGALEFLGIVRRVTKKNGVSVTPRIGVPVGTKRVTLILQKIQEGTRTITDGPRVEHTYEELDLIPRTDGRPGREFSQTFPIKLDPGTATEASIYRVRRIIAEGNGINSSGNNPDTLRLPAGGPNNGNDIPNGTFSTASVLAYFNTAGDAQATVPGAPVQADVINSLVMDQPKTFLDVYASQFRNALPAAAFPRGSGPNGAVTFNDIGGADTCGVIFGRVADINVGSPEGRISKSFPITDPNATFQRVELDGLVFAERYEITKVFLSAGGDTVRTSPASPLRFRAGGEIDLSFLVQINSLGEPVLVPNASTPRLVFLTGANGRLEISPTESVLRVAYRVPDTTNVFVRNLKATKNVNNKGVRETFEKILRTDQENFTPGLHIFDVPVSHVANASVAVVATLKALQGGVPSEVTASTSFTAGAGMSGDDTGLPFYQSIQPDLRVRWKPMTLKVRFNLPDQNMKTFKRVRILLRFSAGTLLSRREFLVNPNSKAIAVFNAVDPVKESVPGVDQTDPLGVFDDVGQTAFVPYDLNRPDSVDDGDLNIFIPGSSQTVGQALRTGQGRLVVEVYIYNQFPTNSPLPALKLTSASLTFPFLPTN